MFAGQLKRFKFAFAHWPAAKVSRAHRKRSACLALVFGLLTFLAFTARLAWLIDDVRPEWRDPEYGHRLAMLRHWKHAKPQRPLLLFAGSSRVQMGVSPLAMDFPDKPGSPLPFNMGYRGAPPANSALHILRVLDAGYVPAAVLFEFCPVALMAGGAPEKFPELFPGRYSYSDLARISELGTVNGVPGATGEDAVWKTSMNPWKTNRFALVSHWLPDWLPEGRQTDRQHEPMDDYGYHGCPWPEPTPEQRRNSLNITKGLYQGLLNAAYVGEPTDIALTALVNRCKAKGIPFAFIWIPESPEFRSWFSPESVAAGKAYAEELTRKHGVPVFPMLADVQETEFMDGYHMLKPGAARYSRWLADTHIKPWLAGKR